MKLSFKDLPCKLITRIYVDDLFIGEVRKDIWSGRWSLHPDFKAKHTFHQELNDTFFSSYKAGKAMVDVYNRKKSIKKGGMGYEFDLNDFELDQMLSFLKFQE